MDKSVDEILRNKALDLASNVLQDYMLENFPVAPCSINRCKAAGRLYLNRKVVAKRSKLSSGIAWDAKAFTELGIPNGDGDLQIKFQNAMNALTSSG